MRTANDRQIGLNETRVQRIGFTLIELLVVISVITLLMGILVPVLGKARGAAWRASCKSNLRQIGVAFRAYLDDNRDIMPPACDFPWFITDPNDPYYAPPITKFLGPVLRGELKVFICKADNVQKYYLRTGNTSYRYHGQDPFDPLGGIAISASRQAKAGIKEKNICVMNDFDSVHPKIGNRGGVNYLYADWHVSNYKKQD
jgi:prepilin-type N-terminal cleavage/methylation domain-containing protein/prepilin-type processing-associated H-X9-DG protein